MASLRGSEPVGLGEAGDQDHFIITVEMDLLNEWYATAKTIVILLPILWELGRAVSIPDTHGRQIAVPHTPMMVGEHEAKTSRSRHQADRI